MQNNILKESNITKIFLIYITSSGTKRRENVTLRYMDNKDCYFAGSIPVNFEKPKRKSTVELMVYTSDGIYKSTVNIIDANLTMNEVMYQVNIPKTWNFIQLRTGTRKTITLPGVLKFNDGEVLNFTTRDLSIGGFSFLTEENVSSIHQKFTCIGELEFPKELLINFPDRKLITEVKFVRAITNIEGEYGKTLYGMKFIALTNDAIMILKNYLLSLE